MTVVDSGFQFELKGASYGAIKQGKPSMTASPIKALLAAGVYFTVVGSVVSEKALANRFDQRAEIGFAIAEQQGIALNHDDPAVGLGSYLVNSEGCNDCHTWPNYAPGGNPFVRQPKQVLVSNFLAGGRLFTLPTEKVCSRNITPDPITSKPAGLSRADFLHVMQTGCDPQDANFHDAQTCGLLQVMPWPNYQGMTSQELKAIYSFLSALPHAEPGMAAQCAPDPQGVAGK